MGGAKPANFDNVDSGYLVTGEAFLIGAIRNVCRSAYVAVHGGPVKVYATVWQSLDGLASSYMSSVLLSCTSIISSITTILQ